MTSWRRLCGSLLMLLPLVAAAEPPAIGAFVSGGIGLDGREEMLAQRDQYNLRLSFAMRGSGEYLGAVAVEIRDAAGRPVLSAPADGPWFYARLAPGSYQVVATADGREQRRPVRLAARGASELVFYWSDK